MRTHLLNIGVPPANIHIRTLLPQIDWEGHHRIELLADMRNAGMKPFYDTLPAGTSADGMPWTGVIFYNDVYLGATHVLELMHQVSQVSGGSRASVASGSGEETRRGTKLIREEGGGLRGGGRRRLEGGVFGDQASRRDKRDVITLERTKNSVLIEAHSRAAIL